MRLEQGRVALIEFQVGVFTNLTQDHLDYHLTDGQLLRGQDPALHQSRSHGKAGHRRVINADDAYGQKLIPVLAGRVRTITYPLQGQAGVEISASQVVSTSVRHRGESCRWAAKLIRSRCL